MNIQIWLRDKWMKNKAPMLFLSEFMTESLRTKVLWSQVIRFTKALCTMFLFAGLIVKKPIKPCMKWSRTIPVLLQSMLRNKDCLTLQDRQNFRSLRVGSRNFCAWLRKQSFSVDLKEFVSSLESKSLPIGRKPWNLMQKTIQLCGKMRSRRRRWTRWHLIEHLWSWKGSNSAKWLQEDHSPPCFYVKHDLCHKACLVADGHLTDLPKDSVYSGVVSLQSLHLVALFAELNGLQL